MNKHVYLGFSILELSKILMYKFWYDYVKPKYGKKAKLCYMDTDSFIVYMKTDDIYKDVPEDIEIRFDTSDYEFERLLPKGKNKKVIEFMKGELGGKIMTKFVGLTAKDYSYLIEDGSEDKKVKGTKKCVIKRKLKFENIKNCLQVTQLENKINFPEKIKIDIDSIKEFIKNNKSISKIQQRFKSERHNVFTKGINKIALNSNDD